MDTLTLPVTKPKAVVAWSSGKDCSYALLTAHRSGDYDIVCLFTTTNVAFDRVAMHGTRNAVLQRQAQALGLDLISVPLPWPCTNEDYEDRMQTATAELLKRGVEVMIFGDLFLEDVRAYREKQLEGSGIRPVFPIWGEPTDQLARNMIAEGFDIRVVTCDPSRLDPSFVGRRLDEAFLQDLPAAIDPCGENGEFHTAVVNMPMFRAPIPVTWGEHEIRDGFAYADLIPADA
jgi:uncharacterized protein (TIGR00290 family)